MQAPVEKSSTEESEYYGTDESYTDDDESDETDFIKIEHE